MSKDEDELGQCLLDELFEESIALNTGGINQEILFNEDDEIKKFFELDVLNCSKILEDCEQGIPKDNLFSNNISKPCPNELKSIGNKEIHTVTEARLSSELFKNSPKNKNSNNILNKIQQTNKEFLQNLMSFVADSTLKSNSKANLNMGTSAKLDSVLNNSTSFLQRNIRKTHKSDNKLEILNEDEYQFLSNSNKFNDFMESKVDITINGEMEKQYFNKFNIRNSISSKIDGIVSNNEYNEEIRNCKDSKSYLDIENYFEDKNLPFSNHFRIENNISIENKINRKTELFEYSQQEQENLFKSKSVTGLSSYSGICENTLIHSEDTNTAEKLRSNLFGGFATGNNISISFSAGGGKNVFINEESLNRAKQIVGGSPMSGENPISFSTGSGKKVSITEESLNRARQIVGGSPLRGSPISGNMPISFSTGSGKRVSINEESLSRAKQIVGGSPLGGSPISGNMPISFSTGSGKRVSINEESLSRAKQIVGGSPLGGSPISGNMPISFSTGNGKKVSITEESLNRAKQIVGGSPMSGEKPISFSTGSGKKVSIDKEGLDRAKKLVGCFENKIENTRITSNEETIKESLREDLKLRAGCNLFEKTKNNIYPNLLNRNNYENTLNKKNRKLTREELEIPEFFKNYDSVHYSFACLKSRKVISPTLILIDHSLETLKKYTFLLKNTKEDDSKLKYIEIDFRMICDEIENFFIQFPILPSNMFPYRQRWLEVQYLLILHDECLKWSRKIKIALKAFTREFNGFNSIDKTKELLFSSLAQIKYPSVQKILRRICKRAIIEFFDAKRSSLIKICEGDFTVSAPLNLRILSYTDKVVIDEFNDSNINRIMLCTDGWYIVKIFINITLIKSMIQNMPRNIFVCGGNWLNSNMEHGHPLEIEASTQDFPLMVYGINLIRPIRVLSGFKLGFHLKPLLFKISKLLNSSEISIVSRESNDNDKKPSIIDRGGGLSFLVQVMVIHIFPICYKEMIETLQDDSRRIIITRDQNEMDISINNEIYEIYEKSLQQPKSDSEDSPVENIKRRRISLESKLLVLDYWKFMNLKKSNEQKIEVLDLINNCSILTLPSGIDIDEVASIKPGTVIRLSWMKVIKNNTIRSLGCSFSKLVPSPKTSLSAKKRVSDDVVLTRVLEFLRRPVLTFENDPENIIKCKGGWPICILGIILQVYPIEERKRGFGNCFEFKVLLLTSMGSRVFVRVHSMGSHDSDLRMCERVNNKLKRAFINSGELDYKDFIVLIENTEFHSFERSTNLYYFNAKVPYSIFTTPYSLGEKHFSSNITKKMLSKVIIDLSFHTKSNIPKLFDNYILDEDSPRLPICTNCENKLSECKCINDELIML
ncbi:BRCA2 family [Cryptosporidium sp. chipmunk genotype I]|uniref:BRCA2 family n=1 Tax=Cryptosporidium sp. chipmunk genotype I TaxID=1280935 RepID=UPI003519D973|nr:BRCA2 family [Cryptosporidium sp. chipmunk genotype I]